MALLKECLPGLGRQADTVQDVLEEAIGHYCEHLFSGLGCILSQHGIWSYLYGRICNDDESIT